MGANEAIGDSTYLNEWKEFQLIMHSSQNNECGIECSFQTDTEQDNLFACQLTYSFWIKAINITHYTFVTI